MANIHDLPIPHFSSLSENDKLTLVMGVRSRRRYIPPKVTKAKKPAVKKERSPEDLIAMLSPEQAEALLAKLEV